MTCVTSHVNLTPSCFFLPQLSVPSAPGGALQNDTADPFRLGPTNAVVGRVKRREACDSPKPPPPKATCKPEVVKRNKTAATAGRRYGGIRRTACTSYTSAFRESKRTSSSIAFLPVLQAKPYPDPALRYFFQGVTSHHLRAVPWRLIEECNVSDKRLDLRCENPSDPPATSQ